MSSQCFIMNINRLVSQNQSLDNNDSDAKPPISKEKVMSYEEKSVGSTAFFKCEACPFMAFAEDDIKFHLFTVHPDLAKSNGLADNIQIPCPGCTDIFHAEETLRIHLRNHHKMGIKDVKKMVKSLVQIALKNAKLKKEDKKIENPMPANDMKMPELIEIAPDMVINNESLPKGVAFISVDELQKMSTPNFEKIDPKEIIQEASINIVYSNDLPNQYLNNVPSLSSSCNVIQMSSVTPDLISSIQPHVPQVLENSNLTSSQSTFQNKDSIPHMLPVSKPVKVQSQLCTYNIEEPVKNVEEKILCSIDGCHVRLKDDEKLTYHRKCHKNGNIQCPECAKLLSNVDNLHTHLWKIHAIDLELPTCEICGYKTYKKYRLYNIHMKCHGNIKAYTCSVCSKSFKNTHQLSKHKMVHKRDSNPVQCSICQREFSNERRMKMHMAAVHDKLKPFKCCHCDYTAARKEELKLHSRSHTGDKPYSCDHCSYRSADHNAMRRHKKIHSKENVYKCKYCPYTAIQSTIFASHMISKHPNVNSEDIHRCPYCPFKSVNKDKYVTHLRSHTDQEGVKILIEMTKGTKLNKPSWTIPSESDEKKPEEATNISDDVDKQPSSKTVKEIPIEVYDCDSLSESIPQSYSKSYCTTPTLNQTNYNKNVTDLSKLDNNSDCVNSESSSDILESHQYTTQNSLQNINYITSQSNIHGFLNTSVPLDQNLLQNSTICTIATNHSPTTCISSNIMHNFPIRLPLAPQLSVRNNITLKPVDKISLPVSKVTGPIIKPTQILPVPSSSKSPLSIPIEIEGIPRKKPKISVKSNLILKGPDQVNMFHSQQQLAFKRLEDNERFGLGRTVSFNNLITTQFMQLQTEPTLSESPTDIMAYQQESMLVESATTPEDSSMSDSSQIFSFNQQMNVNSINLLPPAQKIQADDPSYIKLEATIKQNTQSPSLERMCNANLLNNQDVNQEYKASPPPPIVKSFYDLALNNTLNGEHLCEHKVNNPSIIDQYLLDNMIGDQYTSHIDLSSVVLPEVSDDQQNDVIEIDDNSDDNKLLPRFDMNFPLESLYLMQNDFHFLESEIGSSSTTTEVEVPIINQKEPLNIVPAEGPSNDFPNFIEGKKDPMMNTSVRPTTNKINVKNIELMKN